MESGSRYGYDDERSSLSGRRSLLELGIISTTASGLVPAATCREAVGAYGPPGGNND